jgi:hypothetical protein
VDTNGHSTSYPIARSIEHVSGHPLESIMYWQGICHHHTHDHHPSSYPAILYYG